MISVFLLLTTTLGWTSPFNFNTTWLPWSGSPVEPVETVTTDPLDAFLMEQEESWLHSEQKKQNGGGTEDWWFHQNQRAKTPTGLIKKVKTIAQNYSRKDSRRALDIGSGSHSPVEQLVQEGWFVTFLDPSSRSLNSLKQTVEKKQQKSSSPKASFVNEKIENFAWPKNADGSDIKYDIIIAWDVLPFCSPSKVRKIWKNIYDHLEVGGYFLGSLAFSHPDNLQGVLGAWSIGYTKNIETLFHSTEMPIHQLVIDENTPWIENSAAIIIKK